MTAPLENRLDAICRRQTARYLDRERQNRRLTPYAVRDFVRCMGFVFQDVKQAVRENAKERDNDRQA